MLTLSSVIHLLLIVVRSKLIPDFVFTIHFLHLLLTSVYSHSIPTSGFWWILQILNALLMTAVGIWSCQHRELQPINLGKRRESARSAQSLNVIHSPRPKNQKGSIRAGRLGQNDEYEMYGLVENGV